MTMMVDSNSHEYEQKHIPEGTEMTLQHTLLLETAADADRIGGYLWKFPSEGSNASPGTGDAEPTDAASYPRKCRYCAAVWVSSYVNERRHWKQCSSSRSLDEVLETEESSILATRKSMGVPRRVWCEIDSALTGMQWREEVDAEQDLALCFVPFKGMADVTLLENDSHCFRVTTTSGRRVVFQYQQSQASDAEDAQPTQRRSLDARQWCDYLDMFRTFTRDQEGDSVGSDGQNEPLASATSSTNRESDELLGEITRSILSQDTDALEELLHEENLSSVKTLLDDNGSSLLVVAFKLGGNEAVIKTLVEAGVDCNAKNADGETPLLLAAASGDVELVKMLLRVAEIDVNQRCAMGATAFHAAANAGDVDVLRLLCEHGVAITTAVDENGWTALHYAAACATGGKAMRFLCELITELVDMQCVRGNAALHVAAGCGCAENAQVLLETAANPYVVNGDGHTSYHVAMHNNRIACALAIHEYMDTPRDAYERTTAKEDAVAQAESTYGGDWGTHAPVNPVASYDGDAYGWVECFTEDNIPYYYNSVTGESTWHKPQALDCGSAPSLLPPPLMKIQPTQGHSDQDWESSASEEDATAQRLPLCMIPLVSPLVTLDHPTAATKLDSRRRKDRERRRRSKLSHRQRAQSLSDALYQQLPPPPPPPLRLAYH